MSYVREEINAHVIEQIDTRLHSSFIQKNSWLYFMGLRTSEEMGKLGQPNTAAALGDMNLTVDEVENEIGNVGRQFKYQLTEPNDGGTVDYRGAKPTASGFAEDNEGTIEFRYTLFMEPLKIGTLTMNKLKSKQAITARVDQLMDPVFNRFLKRINTTMIHGGTAANGSTVDMNTAVEQNKVEWKELLGVIYTLTANNIYGQVNRQTDATLLNPFVIDADTDLETSVIDLDLCREVNTEGIGSIRARADINPNGFGCNLFVVARNLWGSLASQADARGIRIYQGGLPGHSISGFRFPIIEHDGAFYTTAYEVPNGYVLMLDLDTWLVELSRDYNFNWSGFTDKGKSEEGGEMYEWGDFRAEIRQSCRMPWLNGIGTGFTAY